MIETAARDTRSYHTTLDRVGLALGVGSALSGLVALGLLMLGGTRDPLALTLGWLAGSFICGLAITGVAGPIWLFCHLMGKRKPRYAAIVGALSTMVLFVAAQTYGFGLIAMPPMDDGTLLYRWISAIASSAILAAIAAVIALIMWRVAYRRGA